jgi:hypothetical protein
MVGPAKAVTIIDVPVPHWEWELIVDPVGSEPAQTVVARGPVVMRFDSHGALDFGTLADPATVPPGPFAGTIDIEILSMSLVGSSPVFDGDFEIGLIRDDLARRSQGTISNLANIAGRLSMDVALDVFVEFNLSGPMRLTSGPISLGMNFGPADGIPANDVLWPPFLVWNTISVPPAVDPTTGVVWDAIVEVHTTIPGMGWEVPEPGTAWLLLLAGIPLVATRKRSMLRIMN